MASPSLWVMPEGWGCLHPDGVSQRHFPMAVLLSETRAVTFLPGVLGPPQHPPQPRPSKWMLRLPYSPSPQRHPGLGLLKRLGALQTWGLSEERGYTHEWGMRLVLQPLSPLGTLVGGRGGGSHRAQP